MRLFTKIHVQLLALAALAALLLALSGCSRDDSVVWKIDGNVSRPAMPGER